LSNLWILQDVSLTPTHSLFPSFLSCKITDRVFHLYTVYRLITHLFFIQYALTELLIYYSS
jgi:hypothetical protein